MTPMHAAKREDDDSERDDQPATAHASPPAAVPTEDAHSEPTAIVCRNVWKIYTSGTGRRHDEPAELKRILADRLTKTEVLERFGWIVGVGGVDFSVPRGETFCIMGLSGSGKSTLVRHLNRLIEPTAGTILIDGEDIGKKRPRELRELRARKTGMVFQDMALWPHRTVRENVAYGLEILRAPRERRRAIAEKMLSLVHLSGWGDRYPDELSGGMRQRVGLARALATDPEILLLDEPFSALDPLIRSQLQEQFLQIVRMVKKTAIFITHDLHEAIRLGDRIAIMKEGVFVQVGTPEEIVMNPEDDYVAEFVKGMSRLRIVRAHSIMEAPEAAGFTSGDELRGHPVATVSSTLAELIDISVETEQPIVIVGTDHAPVGIVTRRSLLRAIQGATR